jgi:insertion element IS1 protein InsB
LSTLERLLGLLSAFEVVVWMTDGWPLYESRLKENCTLSASDIRSALSGITWNLRQHLARLGRKSLSFSNRAA